MKNTFLADIFFHDTCSLHYDIYGVRLAENVKSWCFRKNVKRRKGEKAKTSFRKSFVSYFRSLFQSKWHTNPLNVVSVIIYPPPT